MLFIYKQNKESMIKRSFFAVIAITCMFCSKAYCQNNGFEYGVFKHLGVGVSASTTGIGVDVSTDLTKFFGLRGGISIMPSFNFNTDLDVEYNMDGAPAIEDNISAKGSLKRTTGELLLDFYPLGSGIFLTGGFSFGDDQIIKITAHSDKIQQMGQSGAIVMIDNYQLPVDKNGDVNGEIRVSKFRPYLGIGFGGRAVPKNRLAFRTEFGVQFHGHPKVTANGKDVLEMIGNDADDDFSEVVDKLTVYPVIKLRLSGRIF